jgi:hypothetical protein
MADGPALSNPRRSAEATLALEARILELRIEARLPFRAIAEAVGLDVADTHRRYTRAMAKAVPGTTAAQVRAEELERLDFIERRALEVMDRRHPVCQLGRVVEGVTDAGPVLAAGRLVLEVGRRRAALVGADAPRRREVAHISETMLDSEIARLERDLADLDRAGG